ncbi:hypothetical protein MNB_SUP05-SYMBIONT-4-628 [hydrothermal vent metagenome]|uniref:Uncharacterized protein n=2 Tax=hydrothermal vent metagenome TaxID=652676 RepID=A0A1W1DXL9_9ZZZZ
MKKTILGFVALFFYSSLTLAQGFIFAEQHKGKSSYIVENERLKSKLVFPFKFQAVGVGLNKTYHGIHYIFKAATLVKNIRTTGKDYDWENNQLTVFSSSDNDVKDFVSIGLEVAKDITDYSTIFANMQYRELDLLWSDTKQQNLVNNQALHLTGDTLGYEQKFYQLNLGISYQQSLSNNINLSIKPSVIFALVESVDRHFRRNFYTIQNNVANGYGIHIMLSRKIDKDSTLSLSFNQENYQDKHNQMKRYFTLAPSDSLSASYKYNAQKVGIFYQQQF